MLESSFGPHPSSFHNSSKQFKALQYNVNVQLFVVTDEAGRLPQVIERRESNRLWRCFRSFGPGLRTIETAENWL